MISKINKRLPDDKQLCFYIFSARLIVKINETNRMYIYDKNDEVKDLEFDEWLDGESGQSIHSRYTFKPDYLTRKFTLAGDHMQPIDLKDKQWWSKPVEEANVGKAKVSTYGKYVFAMWPKRFEFDLFLKVDLKLAFERLYTSVMLNKTQSASSEQTRLQLETILLRSRETSSSSLTVSDGGYLWSIIELLIEINKLELVDKHFDLMFPKMIYKNSSELAKLISHFGYDRLRPHLQRIMTSSVDDLINNCLFISVNIKNKI